MESTVENDEIEDPELEDRVHSITDIAETIIVIKRYDEAIRKRN